MLKYFLKNSYFALRKILLKCLLRHKAIDWIEAKEVDSILVVRIDKIGDLVVSVPALNALKAVFPRGSITCLLNPATVSLVRLIPGIDKVIVYRGFFPTLRLVKQRKFSLAIDFLLDYPLKTALLVSLSTAKIKAGFDLEARGQLFNVRLTPSTEKKSMSKYLLDLVHGLAKLAGKKEEDFIDSEPVLVLTAQDHSFAEDYLKERGIADRDFIVGIAPGGRFPSQCWKQDGFAQLADRIVEKYQAKIIIIGAKEEEEGFERIITFMKNKPVVIAGLSLDKLAAIISRMKLLVCNNSGPLHLACALGVATVSTIGPTVAHLWWPQGRDHIVIRRELSCSPCNLSFCYQHDCMKLITVEEMEKAVDILIKKIAQTNNA
jgi:ADP-heptose:LPS heptosyltransferase